MLAWFGITSGNNDEPSVDFFKGRSRRFITITLLSSLILFFAVKSILETLIPTNSMADVLVGILPAVIGMLTALLFILLVERATLKEGQ